MHRGIKFSFSPRIETNPEAVAGRRLPGVARAGRTFVEALRTAQGAPTHQLNRHEEVAVVRPKPVPVGSFVAAVDPGSLPASSSPQASKLPAKAAPVAPAVTPTQEPTKAYVPVAPDVPVNKPQPAPGSRLLGTRAEYQVDAASVRGTSYRGVGVRYWNVYSDGTRVMLEDWSKWTGTIDASLAKTDLEGGNVIGLVFGSPAPVNA